jgi:antitoxin ParD1/3/4
MAQRQTMNVSLPHSQEQFVRAQVDAGRYRTASEVVRDGLRLLEEAEHRRLVEKWIYEDLDEGELALLPEELKARARAHFRELVDEGLRSAEKDGWIDGPEAMARLRKDLATRPGSAR